MSLSRRAAALLGLLVVLASVVPAAYAQSAGGSPSIDLNTADAATLARGLQGIGEARARAIVDHRLRHGPFRSVDELALVRGIGPKTVERNRARLRIGGGAVRPVGEPATESVRGARRQPTRPAEQLPIIIEGMPRL